MTDILERLRDLARDWGPDEPLVGDAFNEAADEIERLRGVEQDAAEWVEERTKRLRSDNERLRAALIDINDAFEELSNADVDQSVKELARGVIQRANRWQES